MISKTLLSIDDGDIIFYALSEELVVAKFKYLRGKLRGLKDKAA